MGCGHINNLKYKEEFFCGDGSIDPWLRSLQPPRNRAQPRGRAPAARDVNRFPFVDANATHCIRLAIRSTSQHHGWWKRDHSGREVCGRRWEEDEGDERWTRRIITQSPTSVETSTENDARAFSTVSVASGVKELRYA